MKKFFGLLGVWMVCISQAGAWGLMIGAGGKSSLLFRYSGQQEVVQPVCVRTYVQGTSLPGLPEDSRISQGQLVADMEKGLNYWFTKSREFLQNKGRSDEFADVLAVVPRHVSLKLMPDCTEPDTLHLVYTPHSWYVTVQEADGHVVSVKHKTHYTIPQTRVSDEIAWTEIGSKNALIYIYERLDLINLPQVLAHEAGHLLGLADQYGFAPYLTPGENTSSYFTYSHVTGKNTRALNNTLRVRKPVSLMGDPRYHAQAMQAMWPDDVDGFINAVDFVQVYHKEMLSPRVVNGWKSFSLADRQVGYAFGIPFHYTSDQQVPHELLAQATEYSSKLGGLEPTDIALLQSWYSQTQPAVAYAHIQAADLHNWQAGEITRRELAQSFSGLQPVTGISIPAVAVTQPAKQLQDLIHLRLPDNAGQMHSLAVSHNVAEEDSDCNFYLIVTEKEMSWFYTEYGPILTSVHKKLKYNKKLSRKETRIYRWYQQMKENQRKTAKCQTEPSH